MSLAPISVAEIQAARERIAGLALRTPLVRLNADGPAERKKRVGSAGFW